MKKPLLIVGGSLLTLIGLGILVGGVALLVLFGTDGPDGVGQPPRRGERTGARVRSDGDRALGPDRQRVAGCGSTAAVEPTNGKEVFVGIGPADDVDTFLDGVSIDEIADFELRPYRLETTPVPGGAVPGDPNDETFWHAAASGTEGAAIDWKVEAGTFRLVIMNVDSSATGVEANGTLGVKVPFTVPTGITAIVLGVVFAGVGVLLLVLGLRASTAPRHTASGLPPGAPLPPPPPGVTTAGRRWRWRTREHLTSVAPSIRRAKS